MGTKFNEYPDLSGYPADNDTYLIYDASAGVVKQVRADQSTKTLDGRKVFVQSEQPSDSESDVGDIWIDIS
jgi:hypothetical protein